MSIETSLWDQVKNTRDPSAVDYHSSRFAFGLFKHVGISWTAHGHGEGDVRYSLAATEHTTPGMVASRFASEEDFIRAILFEGTQSVEDSAQTTYMATLRPSGLVEVKGTVKEAGDTDEVTPFLRLIMPDSAKGALYIPMLSEEDALEGFTSAMATGHFG